MPLHCTHRGTDVQLSYHQVNVVAVGGIRWVTLDQLWGEGKLLMPDVLHPPSPSLSWLDLAEVSLTLAPWHQLTFRN